MTTPFLAAWDAVYQGGFAPLSAAALAQARRSWFDTLAASAAGTQERCTRAALAASRAGGNAVPSPSDAALVLGTASHALDYDDVCMLATCHPSAPPVAALLALLPLLQCQRPGLRWDDLLTAYVIGTETTLRLGQWLGFRHYALGFHATSTLGVVGAATACAHALGLPLPQARAALSTAASSACGLRANFGSDVKPLHVGFAAAGALRAVLLAQAGADASNDIWGGNGFALAMTGGLDPGPMPWQPGQATAIEAPGFELKRFPSCYMTHRLIAGVLAIRAQRPAAQRGEAVTIRIEVPCNGQAALKHPRPLTGLQGKFSGPYCAAAAWVDGAVTLTSFSDAAVLRPALQAQLQRVSLHERSDPAEALESAPVQVQVQGQGWSQTLTVDWAPGSAADPMSREQLLHKWLDCTRHAGLDLAETRVSPLLDAPGDSPALPLLNPLRELLLAAIHP